MDGSLARWVRAHLLRSGLKWTRTQERTGCPRTRFSGTALPAAMPSTEPKIKTAWNVKASRLHFVGQVT